MRFVETETLKQVVLPYRALCEQKVEHFRRVLQGRWDVKELYGQHGRLEFDQTTGERDLEVLWVCGRV